ncbi:Cys/Met metabolism PLP-dependent enzyme-domain-containing protein [Melampsora americana]|nr:Cys/Met metabolism PLP-dependent enzyme-domain-containing protein [Melampsora americana]
MVNNHHRSSSPLSASVLSTASSALRYPRSALGYRFSTLCTTVDNPDADHKDRHGSSSVPIYQTATFKGMGGAYDYSRSGNPSRTFLEHHIAKISGAKHAFAVTSGMGALDIIFRTLKPGDEIIAGNDLYGGSNRLLTYLKEHGGIITHHLDTTQIETIQPFLKSDSKVKIVLLESPTNPLLQIVDIEEISKQIKSVMPNTLIVVDNTMMSPYLMRPLEFGADIVYDSGTKYLSGHHDLMAGLVICNSDEIARQIGFVINSIGNGLAPFDCFLLLRGVKTLAIRLDRQQATAIKVAQYLNELGFKVNYPGLQNHRGKEIHDRLAKGPGAVLSFETGDKELSEKIVSSARLWGISVSFGCVNSLISMPCLMSHASIDPAIRAARNLPEDLIRLCVGIEDCDDLLEDLESALIEAGAVRTIDESAVGSGLERVMKRSDSIESQTGFEIVNADDEGSAEAAVASLLRMTPSTILVSAPGKIILFGEHAVVYEKKALAAALDLKCYCLVEPLEEANNQIQLVLPDSNLKISWDLNELPWESVPKVTGTDELKVDHQLSEAILKLVKQKVEKPNLVEAAHAFLYLFVNLAVSEERRAQVYTVRSALPIGAGLGSSAAYSVSLSTALLYTHTHLQVPTTSSIETTSAAMINRWAFLGEKILHGNPSGVDNTVSTYGGAIGYRKGPEGCQERLNGFKALDFLVTDTKISRDTKALVKSVGDRKVQEPDYITSILQEIDRISHQAEEILMNEKDCQKVEDGLGGLMVKCHELLVSLGVGHQALDRISSVGKQFGLMSKLTGAGGGGCAITLLPNGFSATQEVMNELNQNGFQAYQTKVGGKGVGIKVSKVQMNQEMMKKGDQRLKIDELEGKANEWIFMN